MCAMEMCLGSSIQHRIPFTCRDSDLPSTVDVFNGRINEFHRAKVTCCVDGSVKAARVRELFINAAIHLRMPAPVESMSNNVVSHWVRMGFPSIATMC